MTAVRRDEAALRLEAAAAAAAAEALAGDADVLRGSIEKWKRERKKKILMKIDGRRIDLTSSFFFSGPRRRRISP